MKLIKGDIFESKADAILHQVNCQGVMGSGVAKQVREKYPVVYQWYKKWCDEYKEVAKSLGKNPLLGRAQIVYKENVPYDQLTDKQVIVNLYAQDKYGYGGNCYTDYDALKKCLEYVNQHFKGCSVAIPYLMACHRGGGDWSIVSKLIEETLVDCDVTLYKYCGG